MAKTRILVTGADGFVGHWALKALREVAPEVELIAASRSGAVDPADPPDLVRCALDLADRGAPATLLSELRPRGVLHLAAVSDVGSARADPRRTWEVNLSGTLELAWAALTLDPPPRFVFASTSEIYGASFREMTDPLDEAAPLAPGNPYAASKAAADIALGQLAAEGLPVVRFRPFNHTGPGQDERFVVPAFAAQIARIEEGLQSPVLTVGNLNAERDFLDVRDVVRAYVAAVTRPAPLPTGVALNLSSGTPRRIGDVLDALLALSSSKIEVRADPARMRPSDIPRAAGDASRACALLDWRPEIAWEQTLADLLQSLRASNRGQR